MVEPNRQFDPQWLKEMDTDAPVSYTHLFSPCLDVYSNAGRIL